MLMKTFWLVPVELAPAKYKLSTSAKTESSSTDVLSSRLPYKLHSVNWFNYLNNVTVTWARETKIVFSAPEVSDSMALINVTA
jgi:hypothetical protein